MSTKPVRLTAEGGEELEKIAIERDALKLQLEQERALTEGAARELAVMQELLRDFQAAAQKQAEELKAAYPPPESGFSLNVQFNGKVISGGQITFRTPDAREWRMAFDEFTALVKEREWKFAPAPSAAPPPVEGKAVTVAREAGGDGAAEQVKAALEAVPPHPGGLPWQVLRAERVVILPQPDERVKIEFYAAGHKYADVKMTWKVDAVAGLLKHITSADVTKAADLVLPCQVYYTLGKEYVRPDGGKGHYKDIGHVRPI